ncbi:MAG: hypothetical protein WA397_31245 [Roseiarcus sp.]
MLRALALNGVCVERHRLSLFREQKLPENFADEIVSLPHRYAFGDEVRVY